MGKLAFHTTLPASLRDEQRRIEQRAAAHGLDFFPVMFEMLGYDQMNEVAAFEGFPVRYPHWRFGMEFERIAKSHEYGLSKIYEMVINNNPSIAYLLEGNSLVEQKLVMAHVYAHVDFFKHNLEFRSTDQGTDSRSGEPIRKWVDAMANHAAVVRRWRGRVGVETTEQFIDHCLSLENLIDLRDPYVSRREALATAEEVEEEAQEPSLIRVDREYMRDFINPQEFVAEQRRKASEDHQRAKAPLPRPTRDVLGFLLQHAPLERWEHALLAIVREEAMYFRPQAQTKIMNEGWATYWHSKLMTEAGICDGSEIIDYADRCAGVLATRPDQINPYKLGVELYRHIEDRWNRGCFGKEWEECTDLEALQHWDRRTQRGREKIFQVRALHNDLTFIDEFLTPDFVAQQKLYTFGYNQRNDRWEVESRQFLQVKERLLAALANAGQPLICVEEGNHNNRGELLLRHEHHGVDLRVDWARPVLEGLVRLWRRPVELATELEEKPTHLRYDGKEHSQVPKA